MKDKEGQKASDLHSLKPGLHISLRKPKVFALQILQRYLTKKVTFENFSTVHMDKRTLHSKIWRARTFETAWDFANWCSRNNRRTCLRRCSIDDFKAVNTSIANLSCEIWIPAIITTMWRPRYTWKAYKTCLQPCACDPYDLYGDQALQLCNWKEIYHVIYIFSECLQTEKGSVQETTKLANAIINPSVWS